MAFRIATPLIELTKPQIIQRAVELGVDLSLTVSCYQADASGAACGHCDSCRIRRDGFARAGVADPDALLSINNRRVFLVSCAPRKSSAPQLRLQAGCCCRQPRILPVGRKSSVGR